MKYYMQVGIGGGLFKLGLIVNGAMGSVSYWRACRRRHRLGGRAEFPKDVQAGSVVRRPDILITTGLEPRSLAGSSAAMVAIER